MIDFDRATWLMDKMLLRQAEVAMDRERTVAPIDRASYDAQWLWDYYCERHWEKYGEGCQPNVNPAWDAGGLAGPLTAEQVAQYERFEAGMGPNGFVARPAPS